MIRRCALALGFAFGATSAGAATDDTQLWVNINATGSLGGRAIGYLEVQPRVGEDVSRLNQLLLRGAVGVQLTPDVAVLQGYGRVFNYNGAAPDTFEHRLFQQLNWRLLNRGANVVTTRTRLEERALSNGSDIGLRLRVQLRYQRAFRKNGPALVLWTEPFVHLNRTDWGARPGLDQWRNFAGVGLPLTRQVTLETGYQNRYLLRPGREDRLDHILPVTLAVRW